MKRKMIAMMLALALTMSLTACGGGEETTLTGMVVSVDGTKIALVEMDAADMGSMDFDWSGTGMPEGMEGFQGFGNFNPEDMEGTMPDGGSFPQWGSGEMPEGMTPPEGMTMPEDGAFPGFDGSNGGAFPSFGGNNGGAFPGFGGDNGGVFPGFGGDNGGADGSGGEGQDFIADAETKELDIANAHISVEIDGGKASGSMEDIQPGTLVTVAVDGKGNVTYVLVSSQTGIGGSGRPFGK